MRNALHGNTAVIITMCAVTAFAAGQMPIEQELPVSFGITSKGTYKLDGRFLDARIYSRAISDA